MEWYTIDIDEIIWNYLQKHAVPLTDTANTVLHRLLFKTRNEASVNPSLFNKTVPRTKPSISNGLPRALTQILEVVYEVTKMSRSRTDATNIVADRHGTTPQTIQDKYSRQLNMKANEFDELLKEPDLHTLIEILKRKFPRYVDHIDSFFSPSPVQSTEPYSAKHALKEDTEPTNRRAYIRRPQISTANTTYSSRKKRDTELEKLLKLSLGNSLKTSWGSFDLKGQSVLDFGDKRIICKYSSFSEDQLKWFWGVSKIYWENWQDTDYLALILENDDKDGFSYLLFNADEARRLLNECVEVDGDKKISMRIYADNGKTHLEKWRSYSVEDRMGKINTDWL